MIPLAFDLPRRTTFGRPDFMVSESNVTAVERIDQWPDWTSAVLVLRGPSGCGKTHLAHLWRERASAVIIAGETLTEAMLPRLLDRVPRQVAIDDADRASETALLHLFNSCIEHQGSLLITLAVHRSLGSWRAVLADLRSRLLAAPVVAIGPPDDALLGAVLVKHFADRQLRVGPELVLFLARHIERSFAVAAEIADRLDAVSLREGRAITVPLARELLAERDRQ